MDLQDNIYMADQTARFIQYIWHVHASRSILSVSTVLVGERPVRAVRGLTPSVKQDPIRCDVGDSDD